MSTAPNVSTLVTLERLAPAPSVKPDADNNFKAKLLAELKQIEPTRAWEKDISWNSSFDGCTIKNGTQDIKVSSTGNVSASLKDNATHEQIEKMAQIMFAAYLAKGNKAEDLQIKAPKDGLGASLSVTLKQLQTKALEQVDNASFTPRHP